MANTKLNSILESPGIAIQERDFSPVTTNAVGTNIFIPGFTPQGPTDEPINVSSITEFEEIFGLPSTAAEKYSHNAVKQILTTSNANVTFTRMPYGSGGGLGYSDLVNTLVFPVIGLSAVEKNVCDYYRNVDEETCRVSFPWLYNEYYVSSSICYGSANMNCPLNSNNEDPGFLYVHDHPFEYNSILTGFKFVVDADDDQEQLRIVQLRPTVNGYNTTYSIVTAFNLSSIYASIDEDSSNLSNDSKRLIVNIADSVYGSEYTITSGLLSGQTVTGVQVSAGDVFGTFSLAGAPTLKYFNANPDVASSYKTSLTSALGLSAGNTFTVVTTALDASTQDFLIEFCGVPVEAGLSCDTITSLGLKVPEKDRYDFYPLAGDAQLNDANFYVLGEPISKTLNASEYQLIENEQFNWKCGVYANTEANLDVVNNDIRAGIVVVNKLKTAQLDDFTGFYLALNDNLNVNPATNFDDITGVAGYYNEVCPGVSGEWVSVPEDRWNFKVSETFNGTAGSITEIVQQNAGLEFGKTDYNDSVILSLFKLRPSRLTDTINKLDQIRVEQFIGSLNADRKQNDSFGGPARSFFLENTVNNSSNYLKVMVNPYLAKNNCWVDETTGKPRKTVRMFREKTGNVFDNFDAETTLKAYGDKLYGAGAYTGFCKDSAYDLCQRKDIGNLPAKLERALRNVENPIEFPIDVTIDNGLSTIWATRQAVTTDACITSPSICYNYDDTYFVNTDSLSPYDGTTMNSAIQDAWEVIYNVFDSFARYTRKSAGGTPHVHVQDPLRQVFVNGRDYKIVQRQKQLTLDPVTNQPTEKYSTFGRNIYTYLKNLYQGINSSYSISYANWIKSYDSNTDSSTWFGPSAFAAALYARNDRDQFPWASPLGLSNGIFANVNDLAINPNQRERDLLARIGLNPIVREAGGTFAYNSTTLLKETTALKEISIRRGALWLAKSIQGNLSQFIGLPNNVVTRTRIVNTLRPILQYMKDNGGLFEYLIICDDRNNKAESIDQGVVNVSVYVKPQRPIKFVLVDLNITGTGVNFNELI